MGKVNEKENMLASIDLKANPPLEEPNRQYYFMKKLKARLEDLKKSKGKSLTYCLVTFGCQMNARDSERIAGILQDSGLESLEDEEKADLVIYNTCTVRENANNRVYGRLGSLKKYKKTNAHKILAVSGCMPQDPVILQKLLKSYSFLDIILGTHNNFKFAELLDSHLESGGQIVDIWKEGEANIEDLPSERKYPYKAGVNIMFGCDNYCSYCIVPYVRGRERSRGVAEIIKEIEELVADGVKEVMLLGQNVNSYGKTLEKPITFPKLLLEIEKIEGLKRIRFMTSHPKDLSDELIEVMAKSKKICRHLHLPVQSGSSRILNLMNRFYSKAYYLALVDKIKEAMPDISLTTDIIVAYPDEKEEDFAETLDLVKKVAFDSAFTFIFSPRNGTPAAEQLQIEESVAKERFNRLLEVVHETSKAKADKLAGTVQEVLVEEINQQNEKLLTGRLSNNMLVHFPGEAELIGQLLMVELRECKGFYYLGKQI